MRNMVHAFLMCIFDGAQQREAVRWHDNTSRDTGHRVVQQGHRDNLRIHLEMNIGMYIEMYLNNLVVAMSLLQKYRYRRQMLCEDVRRACRGYEQK